MNQKTIKITLYCLLILLAAFFLYIWYQNKLTNDQIDTVAPDGHIIPEIQQIEDNNPTPAPLPKKAKVIKKALPIPTAAPAVPPTVQELSPFDPQLYATYGVGIANALPPATASSYAATLHLKLSLLNSFTALAWNVDSTIQGLRNFFTNQLQISQVSKAYKDQYGVNMLNDITANVSGFDKGRYFVTQITAVAKSLPKGY